MNTKNLLASLALVMTGLCASTAMATPTPAGATFSSVGGHATTLGSDFDPTWVSGFSPAGFDLHSMQQSGKLKLSADAALSFSFVGKEAVYKDGFYFGNGHGGVLASTLNNSGAFTFNAGTQVAGALDFWFKSNNLGSKIKNGADALGLIISNDKKSALVLFNDNYRYDRDYDDMIIKISIVTAPVPEPETYAMLVAGLGLLGVVARRRKLRNA